MTHEIQLLNKSNLKSCRKTRTSTTGKINFSTGSNYTAGEKRRLEFVKIKSHGTRSGVSFRREIQFLTKPLPSRPSFSGCWVLLMLNILSVRSQLLATTRVLLLRLLCAHVLSCMFISRTCLPCFRELTTRAHDSILHITASCKKYQSILHLIYVMSNTRVYRNHTTRDTLFVLSNEIGFERYK